jgi:iron complex outermembrane recepter protein
MFYQLRSCALARRSGSLPAFLGNSLLRASIPTSCAAALLSAALLAATVATATEPSTADLSLEDLLKVEVTTASRKSQSVANTAAAVFVITRDDIQRSGATTIPEALRLAPGVHVAKLSSERYAISVRGETSRFANKLLVLLDGRSVYSILFSGVLWEFEGTLLEDVERIEVIRGPGGSLWGANAVNAVINIITKKPRDTQGSLLIASAGTVERSFGALRHGGATENGHYRVWAQGYTTEASLDKGGNEAYDAARHARAGFRTDWNVNAITRATLSGGVYDAKSDDLWARPSVTSPTGTRNTVVPFNSTGVNLLGRAEWAISENQEAALQMFVNDSGVTTSVLKEDRSTFDVDFQHRVISKSHDFIWGANNRTSRDRISIFDTFRILPTKRTLSASSVFFQDEWTIVPNTFRLVVGLRLEHNPFTGFEPQPNIRFLWTPSIEHSYWAAASRAVRTPSRSERDAVVDAFAIPAQGQIPAILAQRTNVRGDELDSERVNVYELGYRGKLSSTLSVDIAAFASRSPNIAANVTGEQRIVFANPAPYLLQDLYGVNALTLKTRGLEVVADWQAAPWWRIQSAYVYTATSARSKLNDVVAISEAASRESATPRHQVSLRSSMTFDRAHALDLWWRHVGEVAGTTGLIPSTVPAYTELNARYAFQLAKGIEVSLGGQNLLKKSHAEFISNFLPSLPLDVRRNVYARVKWQF